MNSPGGDVFEGIAIYNTLKDHPATKKQRALNDKVLAEKRDFTPEEKTSYDRMEADANLIKAQVDRQVELDAAEKDNAHAGTGIRGSLDTDEPVQPRATSFGQNILSAYKLGGIMTVSEELMDDAFLDIGDYISGRAAISASFAEEAAYIGGDGNKKPTGFLTTVLASGSTVTSIAPANVGTLDVFAMYYGLTRPYRRNASFVFADSAIKTVRMEKATTGQYIWQMRLIAGAPDTLLGRPVYTSDFLPAVAATTVSAAFGDFSYYQIVDRIGWSMQRLNELYAGNGQIGFRVWERTDGKLLIPAAIITLTQHS